MMRTMKTAVLPTGETVEAHHRPGEGRPIVLLHGAAGHKDAWDLSSSGWGTSDLWSVSLPGRPGSPGAPASTAEAAAKWVHSALAGLGVRDAATWVGHSFGGAVALEAARLQFGVAKLVLVASAARLKVSSALLAAAEKATAPLSMEMAFGPGATKSTIASYQEATAKVPLTTALADWRACDGFDRRAELSTIEVPTLVLYGEADALTPPKFQGPLAEALPQGRAEAYSGVGHMLPWEAKEHFIESVLAFTRNG